VRQLANDLGINFNTVARAYRDLERQGLISSIRGRGTVVISAEETRREPAPLVEKRLSEDLRNFLANARLAGVSRKTVESMIENEMPKSWPCGS
jgi:GntR family transcriptional regulator